MLERDIEAYLVEQVRLAGGKTRKVQWVGRKGAPDRLAFGPRMRPFFVELKRPSGGRYSWQQDHDIALLNAGGLMAFRANTKAVIDDIMHWSTEP